MNNHEFDQQKWASMSLFAQLGNIGSEVGRAMNALRRDDDEALRGAYWRGLDLIDATVIGLSAPRAKELLRAREQFAESVETKKIDGGLEMYFMNYAIAERMRKLA